MSGLDIQQFKNLIIRPVLDRLSLGGEGAVNLVTGTALVESNLVYLHQMKSGPALGLFQMEPCEHDDIWKNFLQFRPQLLAKISPLSNGSKPDAAFMISNLAYACAMCRLCYLRAKDPLPNAQDALGMAVYHKVHYNTLDGKADIQTNIPRFQQAIHA